MKPLKASQFLDLIKKKHDVKSDYALQFVLETSQGGISNWRNDRNHFNDEFALKVAELLEMDKAFVIASSHHFQSKNKEVKQVWKRIAELSTAAAIVIMAKIEAFVTSPELEAASATVGDFFMSVHCILCQIADTSKNGPFLLPNKNQ